MTENERNLFIENLRRLIDKANDEQLKLIRTFILELTRKS